MIRRSFALFAAISLVTFAGVPPAAAQESRPSSEFEDENDRYSHQQLDNLVGAVALYPDALLAQVLVASTFPDQIEEAARFVRANGTDAVDDQNWDVSVKAVAHYPSALNMMADKLDWTSALGRAYAVQSSDVMQSVQRLRGRADVQGNLRSSEQQTVVRDEGNYLIAPTQTRVIYVPVYEPYAVYTRPIFQRGFRSSFWSEGVGFPIGAWLTYDVNWRNRAVYYNGWDASHYGYAGGWRQRSRPFINVTNSYVNPRYRNVSIDRDVIRRRVLYRNVDRYPGVHRDIRFGRGPVSYRGDGERSSNGTWGWDRDAGRRRSSISETQQTRESRPASPSDRRQRDESRSRRSERGVGDGNPSEMMRGPHRNDAPMINPRRAERIESAPRGGGRNDSGAGNGGGRGNREGRERP